MKANKINGKIIELPSGPRAIYADRFWEHGVNGIDLGLIGSILRDQLGATLYSDDFTKVRAGRRVAPSVYGGKAKVLTWDFASLPAGAIGDVLVCGRIRKDDRVIIGREFHGALTSGAGAATNSYGTYTIKNDGVTPDAIDDVDRFLIATDMDAAGQNFIADTLAHNALFTATEDLLLVAVNSVEANATAGRMAGWMLIVRD